MSVRKAALDLSAAELAQRRLSRLGAELSRPVESVPGFTADRPPLPADLRRPSLSAHFSGQAAEPPPAPAAAAPAVSSAPAPPARRGRHARERLSWLGRGIDRAADALPPGLQGRLAITAHHVTVVALVLAAAMAVAAWIAVRSDPTPVSPPRQASLQLPAGPALPDSALNEVPSTAPAVEPVDAAGLGPVPREAGGTVPTAAPVVVHVTGKVRRPGVIELAVGSRVIDAVEKAGGARPGVRLGALNLARPVVDGEQIAVGVPVSAVAVPAPVSALPTSAPIAGTASGVSGTLVNINTADQLELEELPGVGPVTATSIIEWRTEHGGFSTVDELLEVSGIGEITLGELRDLVTI